MPASSRSHTGTFPIWLELCGTEYSGHCGFTFTPEDPGRLTGPPEDCYPPTPAEIELFDLFLIIRGNEVKLDELLDVPAVYDTAIAWLEDHRESLIGE